MYMNIKYKVNDLSLHLSVSWKLISVYLKITM